MHGWGCGCCKQAAPSSAYLRWASSSPGGRACTQSCRCPGCWCPPGTGCTSSAQHGAGTGSPAPNYGVGSVLSSHDALHSASTSFKHGATPLQIAVAGRRGGAYLAGQAAAAICWLAGVGAPRVVRHVVPRVAAGVGAGQGWCQPVSGLLSSTTTVLAGKLDCSSCSTQRSPCLAEGVGAGLRLAACCAHQARCAAGRGMGRAGCLQLFAAVHQGLPSKTGAAADGREARLVPCISCAPRAG